MNVTQIRYFVVAAREQNLSKAAQQLHLSQPALSKSIAKLEQELCTELFIRNGKRIELSQQGQFFLEKAVNSLETLDALVEQLQTIPQDEGSPSLETCL